jgi:hypothetical protein
VLRRIYDGAMAARRTVRFHFYLGEPYATELATLRAILLHLPAEAVVIAPRASPEVAHALVVVAINVWVVMCVCVCVQAYVRALSSTSHLLLDSHHHGSCNTAVDALVAALPMVMWRGQRWNNRIAPAILKKLGLEVMGINFTQTTYNFFVFLILFFFFV